MKELLLKTLSVSRQEHHHWTGLILRLSIGLILFPHGAQKMLGWFGGYGFTPTMGFFTEVKHIPYLIGVAVIIIEFIGSLCLLAGFATRIWSALTIILMLGIIFSSHLENGFFINWFGNQKGEGFEYHLLVIGLSLALLVNGGGKYSVDGLLNNQ